MEKLKLKVTAFLSEYFDGAVPDNIGEQILLIWGQVKVYFVVPCLTIFMYINLVLAVMLFTEMVYMALVVAISKLFGKKPEQRYKWEPFEDDAELGNSVYPLVLVQVPMFNEREVYQLSIGAACGLTWPSDRIVIQVLDDSTDPLIKGLVEMECENWASKGVNIHYQVRDNRKGYKAGALKEGLKHDYAKQCEYVTIFDADFQPEPDFLTRTIPFLHHNSELGLVQGRWKFVNSNDCLMTRLEEMSLNYHFKVEQEYGSITFAFFGFNGTAGVWRMVALDEAGGWKDRTTVEDMDLAVRASLKGWKFLYIDSLMVKNELPSVFKAYRHQQQRWACGPANLFKKMVFEIMKNETVTWWKKLYILYSFFFVRKIVAHIVAFTLYCVVFPATVLIPEVTIPRWFTLYIPTAITFLNALGTPRSFYLLGFWVLFENVMSLHRTKATFIGLFETQSVNEWVVTEKHGDASKVKATPQQSQSWFKIGERILVLELCVGIALFGCACYDLAYGKYHYYVYLYLQAMAFIIMGFGYIGIQVSNS
ncbi:glucomannan 4-beta-mannosyltransferase 9-like [Bidens hawaiensis]|uniref:glucomannan 4-beta-mannosyltransferase 9-like n=1 Tax=Bidens hawaiensis TaxID=980011 RepID=UPI00404B4EFD